MVRQTPPRPLSPSQPGCAGGGAGAQHPGPSLRSAMFQETLQVRGAFSLGRDLKGAPMALCRAESSSFMEELPLNGSPGCCGEDAGPGKGSLALENGNSVWLSAAVHFGVADSRGQHADRLAPAAAHCAARPAAASPACACLLACRGNSPG